MQNPSKRTISKNVSVSWLIKKIRLPKIDSLNLNTTWLHTTTESMQGTCSLPVDTRVTRPAARIVQYLCSQADFHGTLHNSVQMGYLSTYTAGISYWVSQVCTNSVSPFSNNRELVNQTDSNCTVYFKNKVQK
jgi:hypothetical protein